MKSQQFKLTDATKKQIKDQFNLRLAGFQSNSLLDMAEYFMSNGVKRKVAFDELKELVKTEKGRVYTMVSQLKKTHGFDIINSARRGQDGVYQLVGFTLRNRDQEKKVIEAEDKKFKLLNSVFC
ncbi:hypothetical protein NVP1137O_12 [Vibrio phage 1.137.O._10N.261.46.B5]|nr:hypothetical protein NVP1119O_14 [Vibrio phage 1.119.O._10N.261.51.A9]AUR90066.1 hypothetical protein NVP1137O_12 [Vibrio phage 1.137.O._10N.261.46.B5]AUR90386.1 hypothetical protein NVP1143O_14 [Vibrio phage 1.143.O._10N.261.55.C8]AUR96672.1 hypothetical protein NVP1231O_14 [Vibrio phage 1.231.O._10N.261.49.F8]